MVLMRLGAKKQTGFTIVELLIVIVVIAILAAISIVAYNGIQERSKISSVNSSLSQINKAINAYQAIHGEYPSTAGAWRAQSDSTKDSFIPGLVPGVVSSLPRAVQWDGSSTFYYRSNGTDYKLLFLYPSTQTIPASAANNDQVQSIIDPQRTTRGWGYWSDDARLW